MEVDGNTLFKFLEKNAGQTDLNQAEVRKQTYKFIGQFIKIRAVYLQDYILFIYEQLVRLYYKEETLKCKDYCLYPFVQIYKHISYNNNQQTISQLINTEKIMDFLQNQLKFGKPTPSLRARVFELTGLIIKKCYVEISKLPSIDQLQMTAYLSLVEQTKASKPDLVLICGLLKFFRYALSYSNFEAAKIDELFMLSRVFLNPIKEVQNYKIIKNAIKIIKFNLQEFTPFILMKTQDLYLQVYLLVKNQNRDIKENASQLMEELIELVSSKLEEDEKKHKVFVN